MVHGADVAEGPAADARLNEVGDERVARRGADPLAKPVGRPHGDHAEGRRHQSDERPHDGREAVAHEHERPAAEPVGERSGKQSHDRRDGIGHAVDQADVEARAAEPLHERRQQRVDRLAREICQKTRPAKCPHGGG